MAIAKSMDAPDIHRPAGGGKHCYSGQIYLVNKVRGTTAQPGAVVVSEPAVAELVESVIEAGREWNAELGARGGSLWLDRRGSGPVCLPVEIRFTDEELLAYYRRVVDGQPSHSAESPFAWWQSLVSAHLIEAIHETDPLGGPCLIYIDEGGLWATRLDAVSHAADDDTGSGCRRP